MLEYSIEILNYTTKSCVFNHDFKLYLKIWWYSIIIVQNSFKYGDIQMLGGFKIIEMLLDFSLHFEVFEISPKFLWF